MKSFTRKRVAALLLFIVFAISARFAKAQSDIDINRFRVCAFGSDHHARGELPGLAQRRAQEELGLEIPGDHIFVIGDTPADIECGKAIGARAIAVATGRYTPEELARHHPYALFSSLADTQAVMQVIDDA